MGKIRVLLADRRELFREGLARILEGQEEVEVVSTCSSGLECIDKVIELRPDITLLDSEISECDSVETTKRITELLPEMHIIILSQLEEDQGLFSSLRAGAKAYISKGIKVEDIIRVIVSVHAGDVIISPPMAARLLSEFTLLEDERETRWERQEKQDLGLSKRENEVLTLVAEGTTNREIANTLFISENTVKAHLSNILEKLHVHNRQEATTLAREKGIIPEVTKRYTQRA